LKLTDRHEGHLLLDAVKGALTVAAPQTPWQRTVHWVKWAQATAAKLRNKEGASQSEITGKIELLKTELEFALSRFAELKSLEGQFVKSVRRPLDLLEEFHEQQVKSLAPLRANWNELCREIGISPEITLNQLVDLAGNHARISEISARIHGYEGEIGKRRELLLKLEEQVLQWRVLNNSQKQTRPQSSSQLVSEARSIIQYKDDRVKQLNSINQAVSEKISLEANQRKILEQQKTLVAQWKQKWRDVAAPDLDPVDPGFSKCMGLIRQVQAIDSLIESIHAQSFEDAYSNEALGDLRIWEWHQSDCHSDGVASLLLTLKSASVSSPNLLMLLDRATFELAVDAGFSAAKAVQAQNRGSRSELVQNPRSPEVPPRERAMVLRRGPAEERRGEKLELNDIISGGDEGANADLTARAKAALEIFAKKPAGKRMGRP
jgi:hypothetical protein